MAWAGPGHPRRSRTSPWSGLSRREGIRALADMLGQLELQGGVIDPEARAQPILHILFDLPHAIRKHLVVGIGHTEEFNTALAKFLDGGEDVARDDGDVLYTRRQIIIEIFLDLTLAASLGRLIDGELHPAISVLHDLGHKGRIFGRYVLIIKVQELAEALGLDPAEIDAQAVLDLARDAAHGVARPAAPVTTYLVGLAAGRAGGGSDAFVAASRTAAELVRRRTEGQDSSR